MIDARYTFDSVFASTREGVAQLVEHLPFKEEVLGSSPNTLILPLTSLTP